jgi:cellulose biosynthesis protein BcsQ
MGGIWESKMKTIAVYNNKGGVGKTTTVVNLGAALARRGYRVLLIDMDSQANTTFAVGLMKFSFDDDLFDDPGFLEALNFSHLLLTNPSVSITKVIRQNCPFSSARVDIVPSHISVAPREEELKAKAEETTTIRLRRKLADIASEYDFVLIDTPPALGLYVKIALTTCDYLIIPSDLKPFANQGLANVLGLIDNINEFRNLINMSGIKLLGVLPSKIMTYVKFIQFTLPRVEEKLREKYKLPLFESRIYERVDLAKSVGHEIPLNDSMIPDPKSIFDYSPNSESAAEFEALANEVLIKVTSSI